LTERNKKPEPTFASRILERIELSLQRATERGGWARQFIHMAHLIVVGIRRSQLTRMAAALSYRTIFGIVPVLLISVLVLAAFASPLQVRSMVAQMLNYTGLSAVVADTPNTKITASESGMGSETVSESKTAPPGPEAAHAESPTHSDSDKRVQRLDDFINDALSRMRQIPMNTLGLIGIFILVYAAISMLVEIEKAFNQIFNAPEGRSWTRRVTQYWTLLTLGTIFLVASFYAQRRITGMAQDIQLAGNIKPMLVNVLGFGLTVLISSALMVIVYMIVPNTRVQFMPALIGGVTAALLWESGKWGFTRYVATASYSKFYGVVAIVPLFMFWVYITWLIVLSGLQLASALQTHWLTKAEGFRFSVLATFGLVDEERAQHNVKIVDPASVLVVLVAVAERFIAGKPSDHSHVAEKTGIDEQAVADMLERLAGAGLLLRVVHAEREGTYTLARPPEAILAVETLVLSQDLMGNTRVAENKVLINLTRARVQALDGKTIADLMDKPPQPPATPSQPPASAKPVQA
jgi:membrane protein